MATIPLKTTNPPNYGFDFEKTDGVTRYFIIGDQQFLYLYNRTLNPLDLLGPDALSYLNTIPFVNTINDRWQSTVMNDRLYLTTINTPIQVFVDDATPLKALNGDVAMPLGAKYIITSVGHLVVANTVETDGVHPQRVRWSDNTITISGDPETWIPSLGTNEAGYTDINDDSGSITGMAPISANAFLVYTERATHLFTYYGLPVVWNVQRKIIPNIGILAPYSLIDKEGYHYFLGQDGFYQVTPSITWNRIGKDRVDNKIYQALQGNNLAPFFAFTHNIYPEVWWIYQGKDDAFFAKAIIYNWEDNVCTMRDPFPFSMLASFMSLKDRTMDQIDEFASDVLTWEDKIGIGTLILISGDKDGFLYLHDESDEQADGVPLNRVLVSGDFYQPNFLRLSRVFYDIQDIDLTQKAVQSTIFSRTKHNDPMRIAGQFQLDIDARHDIRLVDKIMAFGLTTTSVPTIGKVHFQTQPAGTRA